MDTGRYTKWVCLLGLSAGAATAAPIEREFRYLVNIDATQDWKKNDPKNPGDQYSKGTSTQRYELRTRLRSNGKLEVRNLLDPDLDARLEAKIIHLARRAKKVLEDRGEPFDLPDTPEERSAFTREWNARLLACNAEPVCYQETQLQYAALLAAIDYPGALEEDTVPGRYLYFLPYKGCAEYSRITLDVAIDGMRYNKDINELIPFSERRSADTVNASDGLPLCTHFLAVIDTEDPDRPMYQETVFVPRPEGVTEYTENDHTSRETQFQPLVTAVVDWMGNELRHAPSSGERRVELPLPLPLNQNATWLGKWTGTAKVHMKWSFDEVDASEEAVAP
jgi:hypothetical protein